MAEPCEPARLSKPEFTQGFYTLYGIKAESNRYREVYTDFPTCPHYQTPDIVSVALRVPKAVICHISALSFHHLTTQVPHEVAIALERGTESPRINFPPVSVHRFSREAYYAGIKKHEIDGVKILVYSPEKTIADCFKFRNKLGLDISLEALKIYKQRGRFNAEELMRYGHICRVGKIMKPYLEAMV
jgi:predicted transcriptional regulator of viral defense system